MLFYGTQGEPYTGPSSPTNTVFDAKEKKKTQTDSVFECKHQETTFFAPQNSFPKLFSHRKPE